MQIAILKTAAAIFVAGFLILPMAKQVRAQNSPKQQLNVSETQLRAFAKVYVEVEKIRQAYEPRLKEAKNAQEGKQIETEAVLKMQGGTYGTRTDLRKLYPDLRDCACRRGPP